MKPLQAKPEAKKAEAEAEPEEEAPPRPPRKYKGELKGGLGRLGRR